MYFDGCGFSQLVFVVSLECLGTNVTSSMKRVCRCHRKVLVPVTLIRERPFTRIMENTSSISQRKCWKVSVSIPRGKVVTDKNLENLLKKSVEMKNGPKGLFKFSGSLSKKKNLLKICYIRFNMLPNEEQLPVLFLVLFLYANTLSIYTNTPFACASLAVLKTMYNDTA